jgi:hypothetical protein
MNDIEDVIARLRGLEDFLGSYAVTAWPDALRRVRVESGNERKVLKGRVLDMYKGTMGSLTDLMISRANGDEVDDEAAANAQLDRLRHELWKRAKAL